MAVVLTDVYTGQLEQATPVRRDAPEPFCSYRENSMAYESRNKFVVRREGGQWCFGTSTHGDIQEAIRGFPHAGCTG